MTLALLPSGDRAVLAEFDDLGETMSAFRRLSSGPPEGVIDLVPAARTVLVRVDPAVLPLSAAARWIRETTSGRETGSAAAVEHGAGERGQPAAVVIPTTYDGPDLADAATALGITPAELVTAHSSTTWVSAFIGFAPGFAYLVPADGASWHYDVPRRATSRERVPPGAVGVAGGFSGVYPRESPGGWQLLGITTAALWDVDRDPPALLAPGTRVRFEATG